MKKIMKLMLAFVLTVMYLIPNVSAAVNNNDGVIEINQAISDKKYSVYQILVLDSYDEESNGYIYKVDTKSAWYGFVTRTDVDGVYLEVNKTNYTVKWKGSEDAERKAAFAKMALQYALDNKIEPTAAKKASGNTVTFEGLNLGYYLVDSSLGALCGLTTTKPSAEVNEKNSVPTITKEVMEDSVGKFTEGADKVNTATIGDKITYQTTITAGLGAHNYKLFDTMDAGLKFNNDVTVMLNGVALDSKDYVVTPGTEDDDYTFTVKFNIDLKQNDVLLVEYTATLNNKAIIAGNGNKNTTYLEYGAIYEKENGTIVETRHETEKDITTTYTYNFELVKTDEAKKVLTGAKFRLYDGKGNDANEIAVVKVSDGVYRVAYENETGVEIEAGIAVINGLDTDTYYLEETRNPDGYTKLLDRQEVKINDANLDAEINEETVATEDGKSTTKYTYVDGGVQVINTVGSALPETGGIGTVLFITIGSLMVTLFGLLLVTKYRMSKMDI